jgi:hypothetical protein
MQDITEDDVWGIVIKKDELPFKKLDELVMEYFGAGHDEDEMLTCSLETDVPKYFYYKG